VRQCSGMSPELSRDSLLRLTAEGERMIARVARFTKSQSQPQASRQLSTIERDDLRVVGLVA
jgi:hypothetical protein